MCSTTASGKRRRHSSGSKKYGFSSSAGSGSGNVAGRDELRSVVISWRLTSAFAGSSPTRSLNVNGFSGLPAHFWTVW
jgi:hypothetical protein